MDGEPGLDGGIPVNVDAAQHISHAAQAAAINARGTFAAPAVLGARIQAGGVGESLPQGIAFGAGRLPQGVQKAGTDVPCAAVRQTHRLPAVGGRACEFQPCAHGQGLLHKGPLYFGLRQHIGAVLVQHHPLIGGLPMLHQRRVGDQRRCRYKALVTVMGAHRLPAVLRGAGQLHRHAEQDFILQTGGSGAGFERTDGNVDNGLHESSFFWFIAAVPGGKRPVPGRWRE